MLIDSTTTIQPQVATTRRMISVDVGPYALGLAAEDMLGVHDDIESVTQVSGAASHAGGAIVQSANGAVAAIELSRILDVPTSTQRQPLVITRGRSDRSLGLFVDATSRPQTIANSNWFPLPAWVRASTSVPATAFALQKEPNGKVVVRLILDPSRFGQPTDIEAPEARFLDHVPDRPLPAGEPEASSPDNIDATTSGRGLLVFAPAESNRNLMKAAIAIPMACVIGIDLESEIQTIPTRNPLLSGVAVWNHRPIPVFRLGDALGLPSDLQTGRDEATRLVVLHTPDNEIVGCLAHTEMRSLRTPQTTGAHTDSGIDPDLLLGAFTTSEGPLAVPDLDHLLVRCQSSDQR